MATPIAYVLAIAVLGLLFPKNVGANAFSGKADLNVGADKRSGISIIQFSFSAITI